MAATKPPDLASELEGLTTRLHAFRVMRNYYHRWGWDMADLSKMKPLPPLAGVSGLGNIFRDAAKTIEEVKSSGTSLGTEAAALARDIQTVREHVRKEHEDFHFKLSTLGNGGERESEKEETKSNDSSDTFHGEPPAIPSGAA
jgi:hypothetical protein